MSNDSPCDSVRMGEHQDNYGAESVACELHSSNGEDGVHCDASYVKGRATCVVNRAGGAADGEILGRVW